MAGVTGQVESSEAPQASEEPQVTLTVSLLSGRSAEVRAIGTMRFCEIKVAAAAALEVHITKLMDADGTVLDEQQTLASSGLNVEEPLQAVVGIATIGVGCLVKVQEGVQPSHGWGSVTRDSCGRVASITGQNIVVHFPQHSGWAGKLDEMELVEGVIPEPDLASEEPHVTLAVSLLGGHSAEFQATGTMRFHEIKVAAAAALQVHITKLMDADGTVLDEQQTLANSGLNVEEPLQAVAGIGVGSLVKVREGVQPSYGWGGVSRDSCGRVAKIEEGMNVVVHFPEHSSWSGKLDEMELVEEVIPEPEPASDEPQVTLTVSLLSGRSAEVRVTGTMRFREIKVAAAAALEVHITKLMDAAGTVLDEQQTLASSGLNVEEPLQAVVGTATIGVGCLVKVREGVIPTYGWGSVTRDSCGRVVSINGENVAVNFPEQSGWSGKLDEMELVEAVIPDWDVTSD